MGFCTGGGGAGVCGGESWVKMEDSLMGFGGGIFLGCLSEGGCGATNLGCSGIRSGGRLEADKVEAEPLEQLEGGLGGAICGGFKKEKSSSSIKGTAEGGFGAGMGGGRRFCRSGSSSSPMNSGGGGIKFTGGGGGATVGGGGTNMSSSRSNVDTTDPFSRLSAPTVENKEGNDLLGPEL